jgi:hypothetical protein
MTGRRSSSRWLQSTVVGISVVVAAVVVPTTEVEGQETTGLVTVFESGGISERTSTELDDFGGPVYERHSGTLRMMSVARGDEAVQTFPPGMGVPMSVASWDAESADALLGRSVASMLADGGVVMSERSAGLRGAAIGDTVVLEGWNGALVELQIVGIAPDVELDWSELAMNRTVAESLGFTRVALVATPGDGDDAQELRDRLDDLPVRVTAPDDDVDRTDFVLPTVMVKERFGEFSFRQTRGDSIEIDPAWEDANIVTVDIDPLGLFECHRLVVPYIRSAVEDLRTSGLLAQVDPADFQLAGGCFNARLIRGDDKGFALSRHSWGIAIDINPSTNRYEGAVSLSEAFGQTFRDWGFSWGAGWLRPDGMHFEWSRIGVPEARSCSATTLAPSRIPGVSWSIVERTSPCR